MRLILLTILSAFLISLAWWLPGTVPSAILGWTSALTTIAFIHSSKTPYRHLYLMGLVFNTLGFYWLYYTIKDFGGFPSFFAALIFLLFVVVSSVQCLVVGLIYRNLPCLIHKLGLAFALAWVSSEVLSVRIFPWYFGHTQLGWSSLAQVADIGGVLLISFLMFWSMESLWMIVAKRERQVILFLPFLILLLSIWYGKDRKDYFSKLNAPEIDVALVQANISIKEKHNIKYFEQNTNRYIEITKSLAKDNLLVIWPESVIQDWVLESVQHIDKDPRLPKFEKNFHLLTGALTFRDQDTYFNSALAIFADGRIPLPYHKQILMPFGEYTPLGNVLPWLKSLNSTAGNFTPGRKIELFDFPIFFNSKKVSETSETFKLAALICYEDVVPGLSRDATKKGAQVLTNLTNDAWFGDTVAPLQHHLIASFRAIENRRFLLRSTNSGLTAIVNPLGETVSQLKPFTEGSLLAKVNLISYKTLYTELIGDTPWWCLSILCVVLGLYQCSRNKKY